MAGWERIEVMARSVGLSGGIEARVADPLWLLARQWQVGEFHGDDASQPAAARVRGRSVPLASFRPEPTGRSVPLPAGRPLEMHAETTPEPGFGNAHLHAAARAGGRLARLLRNAGLAAGAAALRDQFPLAAPDHTATAGGLDRAAVELLIRHGLDGAGVASATPARVSQVLSGALAGKDLARARQIIRGWGSWYRTRGGLDGAAQSSWDEERLGYSFSVAASAPQGEVTLLAPDHDGGHLDWYSFDLATGGGGASQSHGLGPAVAPVRERTAVPTPVRYAGMPASRFWEFEPGEVHLGSLEAGPADLARLLVVEFATVYSDDWFVVPLTVPVGTLTELASVEVVDTFGGRTKVRSTASVDTPQSGAVGESNKRGWRLFELTGDEPGDGHPSPWLLIPPTVAGSIEGPMLERVVLTRDETANLAWGIEHAVEGPLGRAVDRAEAWTASRPPAHQPAASTTGPAASGDWWRYQLEATAPPWWVPLLPERIDPGASDGDVAAQVRLRRARMQAWARLSSDEVGPRSELLDPRRPRWIEEARLPRSGIRVERAWQLARWHDGSLHLWLRYCVTPGRGEASSGVCWDLLEK